MPPRGHVICVREQNTAGPFWTDGFHNNGRQEGNAKDIGGRNKPVRADTPGNGDSASSIGKNASRQDNSHDDKVKVTDPTIYDSTVQPNPGNMVSEAFEATATAQFGNQINFGGTARSWPTSWCS